MKTFNYLFIDHPASVGMTYYQHFVFSMSLSRDFFVASVKAIVHAFVPYFFETSSSDYSLVIYKKLHNFSN